MQTKRLVIGNTLMIVFLWLTLLFGFSFTFDTSTPQGSDDPAEADDRMREIKAAIQERENVDHYWPLTVTEVSDADAGEHRKITYHESIADPTQVASHAHSYMKSDELFYQDDTNTTLQITSGGKIEGAGLKDDSVGSNAILLANNGFLEGENTGGTDLGLIGITSSDWIRIGSSGNHDIRMTNAVSGGDDDLHIATKGYVDGAVPNVTGNSESTTDSPVTIGNFKLAWGRSAMGSGTGTTNVAHGLTKCFSAWVVWEDNASGGDLSSLAVDSVNDTNIVVKRFNANTGNARWFAIGR